MLNLLPMPPSCILLARASSRADCVTEASSKSLKLLPMLGVPSLPSREYPFLLGLLPDSSAGRRGERGPVGRLSPVEGPLDTMAGELVDESDVSEW